MDVSHPEITGLVRRALAEDLGSGDVTSEACIPAGMRARGRFLARQEMVLAGVELLPLIYEDQGGISRLEILKPSGSHVGDGEVVAEVDGEARTLLSCERVALNFLQRLSGVATLAARYVREVEGTNCRVLDTRKTTPGLRRLEKMAAAGGGVTNHRMGLWDAILIKNNHIAAAGGVRQALGNARAVNLPVEIEVRTLEEMNEALEAGATHLLLDNFTPGQVATLVSLIGGRAKTEASGGVTLETVRAYALAGVDFVSAGAITHSAPAMDLSFRLDWQTS